MGKMYANASWQQFERKLKPKNGKTHVLMVNSFSKLYNTWLSSDGKYTDEIDAIIGNMEERGYEIIDIKIATVDKSGVFGIRCRYNTLIVYK